MHIRNICTQRTGTVLAGSAVVSTGVVAATTTGSYVSSVISVCGGLLVACIAATTAGWRQKRELQAQSDRQNASVIAEDRLQAAEFMRAREVADLADIRAILDNMIKALQLGDEIHGEFAIGAIPGHDAIRAARRSIAESAISCRLRLGANDEVMIRYFHLQAAFEALLDPSTTPAAAPLAYSIAREHFHEIATERFGSCLPPARRLAQLL